MAKVKKISNLYKTTYAGHIIEIKMYSRKIFLYVDNIERDYFYNGNEMKCMLDDGTQIKVKITSNLLRARATIYVNNVQIDYVSKL